MAAWIVALIAGAVAQVIKLVLALVMPRSHPLSGRTWLNLPGMPSTWAAMCGGLCCTIGVHEGWGSASLAAAVAFSSLVLYDALKLRRTAARQARLLKALASGRETAHAAARLRTLLGENPVQVLGGLVVGGVVSWVCR